MRLTLIVLVASLIFTACESVSHKKSAPIVKDTSPPTIHLKGDKNITIALHQKFIDPGVVATDDFDGDLSSKIERSGTLNIDKVGIYTLTYSVNDSAGNSATVKRIIRVTTFANARLGVLADATVKFYQFQNDGNRTLLFQEKSSKDFTLEGSGKFDTYADKLETDKLYLIEISGGVDYDSNNNGIKESNITINSGKIRAIVTKDEIINLAQKLNITGISELIYEELLPTIKHHFSKASILEGRAKFAKEIVGDINEDGTIDYSDVLLFDPTKDQSKLQGALYNNYNRIADAIRVGKLAILNIDPEIAHIQTYNFARNITFNRERSQIFIADGMSGITIIDNATMSVVGNFKTKDFARHIALSSDEKLAYVADSKAGLTVFDLVAKKIVSNTPTYDTNTSGDHDARFIVLSQDGTKLYLAASESGVLIYSLENPKEPQLIGQYDTPDVAYNIKLSNDEKRLFIADGKSGLIAVDCDNNSTLGTFDTYGSANSVTLSQDETKAYIADGYKGMVIADISDPSNMGYLGHIDTPDFASAITLNSDESKAYIADRKSNIQIVDLSGEKLRIIQSIQTPYRTYAIELTPNESYLYAATGTNGLEIIATKKFTNPFIINHIQSAYKSYRVTLKDDFLYSTEGKAGLQIVNIANKSNLQIITDFNTDGFTLDIAINGSKAYLADGYKGIKKVDISDSSNPEIIGTYDTDGFTSSLQLHPQNKVLIISDGTKGIKLFDSENLTLLDTFTLESKALDITLSDDEKELFVALGNGGVAILSFDNGELKEKSILATNSYIKHITLDGENAYLTGDKSQLLLMDLATKTITKSIPIGEFAYNCSADSNYIYVANGKDGFTIVDKKSYKEIGKIALEGEVRDIAIRDGIAYVASSEGGVYLIDISVFRDALQ